MATLVMKWEYTYDKESTWYDTDSGTERYDLIQGASYTLPHINKKSLEIVSITSKNDVIEAEIYVDYKTIYVSSNSDGVKADASYSYCVAGDSVHLSLAMQLSIEK